MQYEDMQQIGVTAGAPSEMPEARASARPVVFLIPGLGGEEDPDLGAFCRLMRAELDLVPITYLDWTELLDADFEFGSVGADVRRQIESRMPTGPIRVAGYSMGGHLAFLTALAFQLEGRPTEVIAILDVPVAVEDITPSPAEKIRARLERLLAFNPRAALASLSAKVLMLDSSRRSLRYLARHRQRALPFRFDSYLHHTITMQLILRIYPDWWRRQLEKATMLNTPAFLFRTQVKDATKEDLGWSRYCRRLRVLQVAGTHRGMLHPSVNGPLRAAFIAAMLTPEAAED